MKGYLELWVKGLQSIVQRDAESFDLCPQITREAEVVADLIGHAMSSHSMLIELVCCPLPSPPFPSPLFPSLTSLLSLPSPHVLHGG